MTNYDELFNRFNKVVPQTPFIEDEKQVPDYSTPIAAGLGAAERLGGSLLTNTVKGISVIGQSILGAFEYLETNQGAYDDLVQNDKHKGFTWDNIKETVGQTGQLAYGAAKAGVSQGERILQSKNLTELNDNAFSGVELLQNLPGEAGKFYRDMDNKWAKFATSVAGIGIEILLDPSSLIGGAAYKGTSALVGKAAKSGRVSQRMADVAGRAASNLATGNWTGGAVAMGAREGAFAAREKLVNIANKFGPNSKRGRAAGTILEWAMGPSAFATNGQMRYVLQQYAALTEDLPKDMLRIAQTTATVVSRLPEKQQTEAQKLFGELAAAKSQEAEEAALEKLTKLGIRRNEAASLGQAYRDANLRLLNIVKETAGNLPGMEKLSEAMTEYHVRRTYRMFVDPKVREDWLDYLVKKNTAGSWQLKHTDLRNRFMQGLGIKEKAPIPDIELNFPPRGFDPATDQPVDMKFGAATNRADGPVVGGMQTFAPKTVKTAPDAINPNLERYQGLKQQLNNIDRLIQEASPGRDADKYIRIRERLTKQIEDLDKVTAGLGPVAPASKKIQSLQKQIDILEGAIERSSFDKLDKLTDRRNKLQAMLENELGRIADGPANRQYQQNPARFDMRFQDPANPTPQLDMDFRPPAQQIDMDFTKPDPIDIDFTDMMSELKESGDHIYIPQVGLSKEVKLEYADALQKFLDEDDVAKQSSFVGFKMDENGVTQADFKKRMKSAQNLTLARIGEFTADWARAKDIPEEEVEKLVAAVKNSLTYVPGSREFVSLVRTKSQSLADLDPQLQQIMRAEIGLYQVDTAAVSPRTLDPVFHDLFGLIDNFSINAADQGVKVGALAARAKIYDEMRKRGLVFTQAELNANPKLKALGGWTRVDAPFMQGKDDATEYYAQYSNIRAIDAIDKSLGEPKGGLSKGLAHASNLFRRAALGTDPSAHATQFLGNIAMLQMMGMRNLFGDDVNIVKGMSQSFKSVMLNDDAFKDAVDAGVMVTQTLISGQENQHLARTLLHLPTIAEKNGDKLGAMTTIFRMAHDILGGTERAVASGARQTVDLLSNAARPVFKDGTQAVELTERFLSPAAMFQLADQMTRLFAYRAALAHKTQDILKLAPGLSNFVSDSGTRINWDEAIKHFQEIGVKQGKDPAAIAEQLGKLQQAHKIMREQSAMLANDVALNYSDVPMVITQAARTGVIPFVKFQYKATGRIMQFMDERPWAFSPYYAAQRNLNQGLNPDPDSFDEQRDNLSPQVRDAFVIPTGQVDSMGRQEFLDLSRWLPFGMYTKAANGGQSDGSLEPGPGSLVSTPIIDLYGTILNAEEEKAPGQSVASFVAGKIAETFSPAGVGPGSRKVEALARAIQESAFYVDENGQPATREPSTLEKGIVAYAEAPERITQAINNIPELVRGLPITESATGRPKPPTAGRPRTTVEQNWGRYAVPGYGFSSDQEKTVLEYDQRYETRINDLKSQITQIINNSQQGMSMADMKQVETLQATIEKLELQRATKNQNLILGE